jgi:hypothetical protein
MHYPEASVGITAQSNDSFIPGAVKGVQIASVSGARPGERPIQQQVHQKSI